MENLNDSAIIILSLSNLLLNLTETLEMQELNQEQREMTEYLIERTAKVYDKFTSKLSNENPVIPKPEWNQE